MNSNFPYWWCKIEVRERERGKERDRVPLQRVFLPTFTNPGRFQISSKTSHGKKTAQKDTIKDDIQVNSNFPYWWCKIEVRERERGKERDRVPLQRVFLPTFTNPGRFQISSKTSHGKKTAQKDTIKDDIQVNSNFPYWWCKIEVRERERERERQSSIAEGFPTYFYKPREVPDLIQDISWEKDSTKRHHQRRHPGEQQFPVLVV